MIELLSRKSTSGDLLISLARHHLENHEWGLARLAVEDGLARGHLSDPDLAHELLQDVARRMGVNLRVPGHDA